MSQFGSRDETRRREERGPLHSVLHCANAKSPACNKSLLRREGRLSKFPRASVTASDNSRGRRRAARERSRIGCTDRRMRMTDPFPPSLPPLLCLTQRFPLPSFLCDWRGVHFPSFFRAFNHGPFAFRRPASSLHRGRPGRGQSPLVSPNQPKLESLRFRVQPQLTTSAPGTIRGVHRSLGGITALFLAEPFFTL